MKLPIPVFMKVSEITFMDGSGEYVYLKLTNNDEWIITDGFSLLTKKGQWLSPTSRPDETFKSNTRYDFDDALIICEKLSKGEEL
jgi:hypothetical protein